MTIGWGKIGHAVSKGVLPTGMGEIKIGARLFSNPSLLSGAVRSMAALPSGELFVRCDSELLICEPGGAPISQRDFEWELSGDVVVCGDLVVLGFDDYGKLMATTVDPMTHAIGEPREIGGSFGEDSSEQYYSRVVTDGQHYIILAPSGVSWRATDGTEVRRCDAPQKGKSDEIKIALSEQGDVAWGYESEIIVTDSEGAEKYRLDFEPGYGHSLFYIGERLGVCQNRGVSLTLHISIDGQTPQAIGTVYGIGTEVKRAITYADEATIFLNAGIVRFTFDPDRIDYAVEVSSNAAARVGTELWLGVDQKIAPLAPHADSLFPRELAPCRSLFFAARDDDHLYLGWGDYRVQAADGSYVDYPPARPIHSTEERDVFVDDKIVIERIEGAFRAIGTTTNTATSLDGCMALSTQKKQVCIESIVTRESQCLDVIADHAWWCGSDSFVALASEYTAPSGEPVLSFHNRDGSQRWAIKPPHEYYSDLAIGTTHFCGWCFRGFAIFSINDGSIACAGSGRITQAAWHGETLYMARGNEILGWRSGDSEPKRLTRLDAPVTILNVRDGIVGDAHNLYAIDGLATPKPATIATENRASLFRRGRARLLHHYPFESEVCATALSPCGNYLAVASWVGEDYERGGTLSIWHTRTGNIVNVVDPIVGAVGWPDYARQLQWTDDSRWLWAGVNTNSVVKLDPFSPAERHLVNAQTTNGWSRPPAFAPNHRGDIAAISSWDERSPIPFCLTRSGSAEVSETTARWLATANSDWNNAATRLWWSSDDSIVHFTNNHGDVGAVDIKAQKLLYQLKFDNEVEPSPCGRYFASADAIYDAVTGESLRDDAGCGWIGDANKNCLVRVDGGTLHYGTVADGWVGTVTFSNTIEHVALGDDGMFLFYGDGVIEILEAESEGKGTTCDLEPSGLALHQGRLLAWSDKGLRIWDENMAIVAQRNWLDRTELVVEDESGLEDVEYHHPVFPLGDEGAATGIAFHDGVLFANTDSPPVSVSADGKQELPLSTWLINRAASVEDALATTTSLVAAPTAEPQSIGVINAESGWNLAALSEAYAKVTADFRAGWRTHIDEHLLKYVSFLCQRDEVVAAEQLLDRYIHEAPSMIVALAHIARASAKAGDKTGADARIHQAIAHLPKIDDWARSQCNAAIASYYTMVEEPEQAKPYWAAAHEGIKSEASNPMDYEVAVADAYLCIGRIEDAIKVLRSAEDWDAWSLTRHIAAAARDGYVDYALRVAREHIEKTADEDSEYIEPITNALCMAERYDDARAWLDSLVVWSTDEWLTAVDAKERGEDAQPPATVSPQALDAARSLRGDERAETLQVVAAAAAENGQIEIALAAFAAQSPKRQLEAVESLATKFVSNGYHVAAADLLASLPGKDDLNGLPQVIDRVIEYAWSQRHDR